MVDDTAAAGDVLRHVQIEILVLNANVPGSFRVALLDVVRQDPNWQEPLVIVVSAKPNRLDGSTSPIEGGAIRLGATSFDGDDLVAAVQQAAQERSPARPHPAVPSRFDSRRFLHTS